jgi:hypothetical protein
LPCGRAADYPLWSAAEFGRLGIKGGSFGPMANCLQTKRDYEGNPIDLQSYLSTRVKSAIRSAVRLLFDFSSKNCNRRYDVFIERVKLVIPVFVHPYLRCHFLSQELRYERAIDEKCPSFLVLLLHI